jgi:hypothetical protein
LLSQPSQKYPYTIHNQTNKALLGTKFVKQTENSTKRCSSNAQKVGNSSIHENNMKHDIIDGKSPLL